MNLSPSRTPSDFDRYFDVIIIGGGHAGCEAAHAAALLKAKTLLITHNLNTIGQMSCNPAIGGVGKGHLVRELDALGGLMAQVADTSALQFRLLNRRKGPAVRGPRAQIDRQCYSQAIRHHLEKISFLHFCQAEVVDFCLDGKRVTGVKTDWDETIGAHAIVLTTGTFLNGLIHIGERTFSAGRLGDSASLPLTETLKKLNLSMGRLKTGTPPRLDGRTIRWNVLETQEGDVSPTPLSFMTDTIQQHQIPCHITHTNTKTHRWIRDNLHRSPLYTGQIQSVGPRYCPSIEDKVVRFPEREEHQIFLEPEGFTTREVYPNGISTSLPLSIQWKFLQSIHGLEEVVMVRPAYAIEYQTVDPRQLKETLAVNHLTGLFLAGQINGTTGYEEAATQGFVAGVNAARQALERDPIHFNRTESYIGVMIDDLITHGVDEPYRMFTSRAEFRLLLRADNADFRLTPRGRTIGTVSDERWRKFQKKHNEYNKIKNVLTNMSLKLPNREKTTAWKHLRQTGIGFSDLKSQLSLKNISPEVTEALEVEAHYAGYLQRQEKEVARFQKHEHIPLPASLPWDRVSGLSMEVRGRLSRANPTTLGRASRIPGVTPAAISALLVYLKKNHEFTVA